MASDGRAAEFLHRAGEHIGVLFVMALESRGQCEHRTLEQSAAGADAIGRDGLEFGGQRAVEDGDVIGGVRLFRGGQALRGPASKATAAPDKARPLLPRKLRRVTSNPVRRGTIRIDMVLSSLSGGYLSQMRMARNLFPLASRIRTLLLCKTGSSTCV